MKLFFIALTSLFLSLALLLMLLNEYHFRQIKERGELMLCLKETKGELHQFILLTEKLNWAIKHIDKAKYLVFIPGLQAVAANAEKAKNLIQKYQDLSLAHYLIKLTQLQRRCRLAPNAYKTPYLITVRGFKRHFDGTTFWRMEQWNTKIFGKYEYAQITISSKKGSLKNPEIKYQYSINKVSVLSLLPSLWASSHSPSLSLSI